MSYSTAYNICIFKWIWVNTATAVSIIPKKLSLSGIDGHAIRDQFPDAPNFALGFLLRYGMYNQQNHEDIMGYNGFVSSITNKIMLENICNRMDLHRCCTEHLCLGQHHHLAVEVQQSEKNATWYSIVMYLVTHFFFVVQLPWLGYKSPQPIEKYTIHHHPLLILGTHNLDCPKRPKIAA